MAAFFFISGHFQPKKDVKFLELLYQYLFGQFLFYCMSHVFSYWSSPQDQKFSTFIPFHHLWYYYVFLIYRVITPHILSYPRSLTISLSLVASAAIGFDSGIQKHHGAVVCYYIFYLVGAYTEQGFYEKLKNKFSVFVRWLLFGSVYGTLVLILKVGGSSVATRYYYLVMLGLPYSDMQGYPGLPVCVYRVLMTLLMLLLTWLFFLVVPRQKLPLVSTMGQNTFNAYLLHVIVVVVVREHILAQEYIWIGVIFGASFLMMSPPVNLVLQLVLSPFPWLRRVWHFFEERFAKEEEARQEDQKEG